MMTHADVLSFEDAALQRFTDARRQGQPPPPEVEQLFDSLGIWWDEIEQEYFSMSQVYSDSVADLIKNNLPADN